MSESEPENEFFRLNPFLAGIKERLSRLSKEHRLAFSVYCCERLHPSYVICARRIGLDEGLLAPILSSLWERVVSPEMEVGEVARYLAMLEDIEIDSGDEDLWDGAIDAIGSISLALDVWRSGSESSAARVAGKVINRVYQKLTDESAGRTYNLSARQMAMLNEQIADHPEMKWTQKHLLDVITYLCARGSLTRLDASHLHSLAVLFLPGEV